MTVAGVTVTVNQSAQLKFTDDPLTTSTAVKAIHISELRARIDALRFSHGLGGFNWTDPTITAGVTTVKEIHLRELRNAVNQVYTVAGRVPPTYIDPTPIATVTPIMRVHITELREAVQALE